MTGPGDAANSTGPWPGASGMCMGGDTRDRARVDLGSSCSKLPEALG
jgi:hypothetical protein